MKLIISKKNNFVNILITNISAKSGYKNSLQLFDLLDVIELETDTLRM